MKTNNLLLSLGGAVRVTPPAKSPMSPPVRGRSKSPAAPTKQRKKSQDASRAGSPKVGSPKVQTPKVGSSKVQSPKVGSPKVGSPRVGRKK